MQKNHLPFAAFFACSCSNKSKKAGAPTDLDRLLSFLTALCCVVSDSPFLFISDAFLTGSKEGSVNDARQFYNTKSIERQLYDF